MQTPWGISQSVRQIARGIVSVTTAGHGGLALSPDRWTYLRGLFPFTSYAGEGWLEEDCDACLALIVWPEAFSPEAVASAVRMVSMYDGTSGDYFGGARAWLETPAGGPARAIADALKANLRAVATRLRRYVRQSMSERKARASLHCALGEAITRLEGLGYSSGCNEWREIWRATQ